MYTEYTISMIHPSKACIDIGQDIAVFSPLASPLPWSLSPGGIYDLIQAPQGKAGSATSVMSAAKLKIQGEGVGLLQTELGYSLPLTK